MAARASDAARTPARLEDSPWRARKYASACAAIAAPAASSPAAANPALRCRPSVTMAARAAMRGCRPPESGGQPGRRCEHDQQPGGPAPPAAPAPEGAGRLGRAGGGTGLRRDLAGVVFRDQRLGVCADGAGDGADVPARVEVSAAGREVVPLDPPDDGLPDPGPLADLRNGRASPLPGRGQDLADAHPAPPLPRSRRAARRVMAAPRNIILPPIPQRDGEVRDEDQVVVAEDDLGLRAGGEAERAANGAGGGGGEPGSSRCPPLVRAWFDGGLLVPPSGRA